MNLLNESEAAVRTKTSSSSSLKLSLHETRVEKDEAGMGPRTDTKKLYLADLGKYLVIGAFLIFWLDFEAFANASVRSSETRWLNYLSIFGY